MTTFDEIYSNVMTHRRYAIELTRLTQQVSEEKAKGKPMINWFRGRNRRVNQVIRPLAEEAKELQKKEQAIIKISENATSVVYQAKSLIESGNFNQAQSMIETEISTYFTIDFDLRYERNEAYDLLNELNKRIQREVRSNEEDLNYYKMVEKTATEALAVFQEPKKTADINYSEFDRMIQKVNEVKNGADISLPDLTPLPTDYVDTEKIESLHAEIREAVAQIDSCYPMGLFKELKQCLRKIIHDVGNDRGEKAFKNRSEEVTDAGNLAIDKFNKKYWQITGSRWERIGTNQHGYRSVTPTHTPVPLM